MLVVLLWSLHRRLVRLVVDAMGGPVEDANYLNLKRHQLSLQLNCVLLPLGLLRVGLSCHMSLLFKVISLTTHLMRSLTYIILDNIQL
jgi:hypothetical protein